MLNAINVSQSCVTKLQQRAEGNIDLFKMNLCPNDFLFPVNKCNVGGKFYLEVASIHHGGTKKCDDLTSGEIQLLGPLNLQVSEKAGLEERTGEDVTFTSFSKNLV